MGFSLKIAKPTDIPQVSKIERFMEMLFRLWRGPRLAINQLNPDILELEGICLGVGEAVFLLVGKFLELRGRDEIGDCPYVAR